RSLEVALECSRSNWICAPLLAQAGVLEEQLPGDHIGLHRAEFGHNRFKVPCGLVLIVGCAGLDDLLEVLIQNFFDSNLVNLLQSGLGPHSSPLLDRVFEYVPHLVPVMRFLARLLSRHGLQTAEAHSPLAALGIGVAEHPATALAVLRNLHVETAAVAVQAGTQGRQLPIGGEFPDRHVSALLVRYTLRYTVSPPFQVAVCHIRARSVNEKWAALLDFATSGHDDPSY